MQTLIKSRLNSAIKQVFNKPSEGAKSLSRNYTTFDAVAQTRIELTEPITLNGDFEISATVYRTLGDALIILGTPDNYFNRLGITPDGAISLRANTDQLFFSINGLFDNYSNKLTSVKVTKVGTEVMLYLDNAPWLTINYTGTESITFDSIGRNSATFSDGIIADVKVIDAGVTVLDMPIDSAYDATRRYVANNAVELGEPINSVNEMYFDGTEADYSQQSLGAVTEIGKQYLITANVVHTSGDIKINTADIDSPWFNASSSVNFITVPQTEAYIRLQNGANNSQVVARFVGSVTNIKVYDLSGIVVGKQVNFTDADTERFTYTTDGWAGKELITQDVWENPAGRNAAWVYSSNDNTYTLTGDGSYQDLGLIAATNQPDVYVFEGTAFSLSGGHLLTVENNADAVGGKITTTGKYKVIADNSVVNRQVYKRASGVVNATLGKPSLKKLLLLSEQAHSELSVIIDPPQPRNFLTFDNVAQTRIELSEPIVLDGDFEISLKIYTTTNYYRVLLGGITSSHPSVFITGQGALGFADASSTITTTADNVIPTNKLVSITLKKVSGVFTAGIGGVAVFTGTVGTLGLEQLGTRKATTVPFFGVMSDVKVIDDGTTVLDMPLDGVYAPHNQYVSNDVVILGNNIATLTELVFVGDEANYFGYTVLPDADVNKSYLVTYTQTGTGWVKINTSTEDSPYNTNSAEVSFVVSGTTFIQIQTQLNSARFAGTVSNIQVREVTGIVGKAVNFVESDSERYQYNNDYGWLSRDIITQAMWESPASIDDAWVYNAQDNTYTLNGTGSLEPLNMLFTADTPDTGVIRTNVTSLTGSGILATSSGNNEASKIQSEGTHEFKFNLATDVSYQYKRLSGAVTATITKPSFYKLLEKP